MLAKIIAGDRRWRARRKNGSLKVRRAFFTRRMANFRTLRLLILKGDLTLWATALRLWLAGAADQLHVADGAVAAEMAGDGEIIDSADG